MSIKKVLTGNGTHMPPNWIFMLFALFFAFVTVVFLIVGFALGALLYPFTRDIGIIFRWFAPSQ